MKARAGLNWIEVLMHPYNKWTRNGSRKLPPICGEEELSPCVVLIRTTGMEQTGKQIPVSNTCGIGLIPRLQY